MENKNKRLLAVILFFFFVAVAWFLSFKVFGFGPGYSRVIDEYSQDTSEDFSEEPFFGNGEYPVFIIFDNHPDSRPFHSGFSEAAFVYEYLAEGGSTRFGAVFAGAPKSKKIGPIRSARPYTVDIASGWGALFMHAGGSPEALDLIKSRKTDITDLNEISSFGPIYFWRDNQIRAPHNLFTSGKMISDALEYFELSEPFDDKILLALKSGKGGQEIVSGESAFEKTANSVYIDFSPGLEFDAHYEYDPQKGCYLRFMGGIAHKDSLTGEQILAANIIVQKVLFESFYPSGYERIKIDMTGEGEAMFFKDGKMTKGTWKNIGQNSQTEFFGEDGSEFILKPGQTWIEIVPGERVVSFE